MNRCFIGLGANLDQPLAQLRQALTALKMLPNTQFVSASAFYTSKPMGPQDQPDYVNAVAAIDSQLTPEALLDQLQLIEQQQGRQRKANRWGPRTLDLDILLYGQQTINTERLTVPHYGLTQREFVLFPLAEIAPDLILPDGTTLQHLLTQVCKNGLHKLCDSCS